MKSAVETLDATTVKLTVEVSDEELKPSIDHAYQHIGSQVQIPGFRKGKVPPRIIDQRVGRAAVIEHAVNDGHGRRSTARPSPRRTCARWASPRSRSPRSPR